MMPEDESTDINFEDNEELDAFIASTMHAGKLREWIQKFSARYGEYILKLPKEQLMLHQKIVTEVKVHPYQETTPQIIELVFLQE